jgi:hypothetical protein
MKTTKEKIAVMQAFEDGEKIEIRERECEDDEWMETPEPCWNWFAYDYRVKQEPLECWVVKLGTDIVHVATTKDRGMMNALTIGSTIHHMREVIE